jgi:uncharacterized protein (DUF1697 family)
LTALLQYVALLRAINVGGHVVTMDRLRAHFESCKLKNVKTFIASGNVIFESPVADAAGLEVTIERVLQKALGYPVATFLRTAKEMTAAAAHDPFPADRLVGASVYVVFLKSEPSRQVKKKIVALRTDLDDLDVRGREVYWLRRDVKARAGEPGPPLDRVLEMPATTRNITTVRKIAEKYCGLSRQ